MPLAQLIGVFTAGGLGALARLVLAAQVDTWAQARLPLLPQAGLLAVNVAGCFAIGAASHVVPETWRPAILGGFLGGFTTYSAFGLASLHLLLAGRLGAAGTVVLLHLVLGLLATLLGLTLARAAL